MAVLRAAPVNGNGVLVSFVMRVLAPLAFIAELVGGALVGLHDALFSHSGSETAHGLGGSHSGGGGGATHFSLPRTRTIAIVAFLLLFVFWVEDWYTAPRRTPRIASNAEPQTADGAAGAAETSRREDRDHVGPPPAATPARSLEETAPESPPPPPAGVLRKVADMLQRDVEAVQRDRFIGKCPAEFITAEYDEDSSYVTESVDACPNIAKVVRLWVAASQTRHRSPHEDGDQRRTATSHDLGRGDGEATPEKPPEIEETGDDSQLVISAGRPWRVLSLGSGMGYTAAAILEGLGASPAVSRRNLATAAFDFARKRHWVERPCDRPRLCGKCCDCVRRYAEAAGEEKLRYPNWEVTLVDGAMANIEFSQWFFTKGPNVLPGIHPDQFPASGGESGERTYSKGKVVLRHGAIVPNPSQARSEVDFSSECALGESGARCHLFSVGPDTKRSPVPQLLLDQVYSKALLRGDGGPIDILSLDLAGVSTAVASTSAWVLHRKARLIIIDLERSDVLTTAPTLSETVAFFHERSFNCYLPLVSQVRSYMELRPTCLREDYEKSIQGTGAKLLCADVRAKRLVRVLDSLSIAPNPSASSDRALKDSDKFMCAQPAAGAKALAGVGGVERPDVDQATWNWAVEGIEDPATCPRIAAIFNKTATASNKKKAKKHGD
jgi:hypothetical protein